MRREFIIQLKSTGGDCGIFLLLFTRFGLVAIPIASIVRLKRISRSIASLISDSPMLDGWTSLQA